MIKNSFVILALALIFFTRGHAEQKFQSHDSIYRLVKNTIARNIKTADYEISVLPLDNLLKLPEAFPTPKEVLNAHPIIAGGGGYGGFKVRAKSNRASTPQKRAVGGVRLARRKGGRRRKPRTTSPVTSTSNQTKKEAKEAKNTVRVRINPKVRAAAAKRTAHPKPTWLKKYQFKKGGK